MKKGVYRKYIEPGEHFYDMDGVLIEPKILNSPKFISSHQHYFMKLFLEGIQTLVFQKIGDAYKYMGVLMECTDFDNSIKMERFKSTISLSENAYYALRKKLVDNAVIAEKDKEWYINPIIMMKSDKVLTDVWLLFKDKSKKIYGVNDL